MTRKWILLLLAALLSIVPLAQAQDEEVEISILQWNHFVPRYDEWFDDLGGRLGRGEWRRHQR